MVKILSHFAKQIEFILFMSEIEFSTNFGQHIIFVNEESTKHTFLSHI